MLNNCRFFFSLIFVFLLGCGQSAEEYNNQGSVKDSLHDDNDAIASYTRAIKLNPRDAEAYNNRGIAEGELQDYGGAIADHTKAIEINPNYADAYYYRGFAKGVLLDYSGAIADYTRVIEINPKDADAYFKRGQIEIDLNQKDSGCLDLNKAGELGITGAYDMIEKYCD